MGLSGSGETAQEGRIKVVERDFSSHKESDEFELPYFLQYKI
jgi:hypothetical protein